MTPEAFVAAVVAGQILAGAGGARGEQLIDGRNPLRATDVDAVTAEAFNQDVFDPEATSWEAARTIIARLLAEDT